MKALQERGMFNNLNKTYIVKTKPKWSKFNKILKLICLILGTMLD